MPDPFDPSPIIEIAPWARRRIHLVLSAATWPAAPAVIIAHAARCPGFGSERATSLTALWLIVLGALGCPAYGLRLFGYHLTLRASLLLSAAAAATTILLTALFAAGALAAPTSIQLLELGVPMALGVQSFNASEARAARLRDVRAAEAEAERRIAAALQTPCAKCRLREQVEREEAKLRALTRLRNLSPQEAAELVDVVLDVVASSDGRGGGPSRA